MLDGRFDQHFAQIFASPDPEDAEDSRVSALATGLLTALVLVIGLALVVGSGPDSPSGPVIASADQ